MRAAVLALALAACSTPATSTRHDAGDVDAGELLVDAGEDLGTDAGDVDPGDVDAGELLVDAGDDLGTDAGDVDAGEDLGTDAGYVDAGELLVDAGDACARAAAANPLPACATDRCLAGGPIPERDVEECEAARAMVTVCSTIALYPAACYFVGPS